MTPDMTSLVNKSLSERAFAPKASTRVCFSSSSKLVAG
jgi:hypothetical protein